MTRDLTEKEALEKALRLAARNGDTKQITALLKRGVNINGVHKESGQTALMYAAANGNKEAVELLLKNGANINQDDKKGYSALAWAVSNGKTDMVNLLIARGADVNAKTATNHRILDMVRHKLKNASPREAAEYRKIEQALMNAGAKVLICILGYFRGESSWEWADVEPGSRPVGRTGSPPVNLLSGGWFLLLGLWLNQVTLAS